MKAVITIAMLISTLFSATKEKNILKACSLTATGFSLLPYVSIALA